MQRFRRDGLTFEVRDAGPEDGPVIVLLHGFPQFSDCWDAVTPKLTAEGFRCVAFDQRGYSRGARPRSRRAYRVGELVGDVCALVDGLGVEQVHLVGHDWGAVVAWAVAAAAPRRLASLTALSVPHPAAFGRAMLTTRQFFASWYTYAFQLPRLPELTLLGRDGRQPERFVRAMVRTGQSPERARRDAASMIRTGALTSAINWYRAALLSTPRHITGRVDVPSLFVWSDGDTAVTRAAAESCHDWVSGPFRYEVLSGVSHWIPDAVPDRCAELILSQVRAFPTQRPAA